MCTPIGNTAQLSTKGNGSLWMQVKVKDDTGNLGLFMREKAAMSLSGAASKEDSEAGRADASLGFPIRRLRPSTFASLRCLRHPLTAAVL